MTATKLEWFKTILIGVLVVVIVWLWVREPDKQAENQEIIKLENQIRDRDARDKTRLQQIQALLNDQKSDSISTAKKLDSTEAIIQRLQRRIKAIDTRTATAPQLDSILNVLYP